MKDYYTNTRELIVSNRALVVGVSLLHQTYLYALHVSQQIIGLHLRSPRKPQQQFLFRVIILEVWLLKMHFPNQLPEAIDICFVFSGALM